MPCLHQGNIYTKRKLRVWRDQKCIPLVGAINSLNGAVRQNPPSRGRQHRAQNRKLRKFSRTYLHGTVIAQRKYLYQKEAKGMERPEMYFPIVGTITPLNGAGHQITPSRGRQHMDRTESWVNWDGPISMVPCLHQGNIYTKRKLSVWRDQKCIPLVGAIAPLNGAGRQSTPSRGRQYRAQNGKLRKL